MEKLRLLSEMTSTILTSIINNQTICKLLYYNTRDPLSEPDLILPAENLLMAHIFPHPFNPNVKEDDKSEIRVFYESGRFNSYVVENSRLIFDVIVAKNNWRIAGRKIRPYEIMIELVNSMHDKLELACGKLYFTNFRYVDYTNDFGGYQLFAQVMNFSTGKK